MVCSLLNDLAVDLRRGEMGIELSLYRMVVSSSVADVSVVSDAGYVLRGADVLRWCPECEMSAADVAVDGRDLRDSLLLIDATVVVLIWEEERIGTIDVLCARRFADDVEASAFAEVASKRKGSMRMGASVELASLREPTGGSVNCMTGLGLARKNGSTGLSDKASIADCGDGDGTGGISAVDEARDEAPDIE